MFICLYNLKNTNDMKKMLKLSLFLAVLSLVFVSCSGGGGRDDEPSNFYVKFKVNGVQKEFRAAVVADYKYNRAKKNHFRLDIGGRSVQSIDSESFTIDLYVPENSTFDLKEGRYIPTETAKYYLDIKYFDGSGWHFDDVDNFVTNVSQVDKKTAKGTFSGKTDGSNLVITDGEFYAPVKYTETD